MKKQKNDKVIFQTFYDFLFTLNVFVYVPFLHHLKTSENHFWFSGGVEMKHWDKYG